MELKINFLVLGIFFLVSSVFSEQFLVYDDEGLHSALESVSPGDTIIISTNGSDRVIFKSQFIIEVNGTEEAPITLRGHPDLIFEGAGPETAIFIVRGSYWHFSDIHWRRAELGIYIQGGHFNQFRRITSQLGSIPDTRIGIFISYGNGNSFSDFKIFTSSEAIGVHNGNGNKFENGSIFFEENGLTIFGGNNNIVENVYFTQRLYDPIYESGFFIYARVGTNLTLKFNRFTQWGPISESSTIIDLEVYAGGLLDGNIFHDKNGLVNPYPIFSIGGEGFIISNNEVYTDRDKYSEVFALKDFAIGTFFQGNKMYFPRGENEPICIFGNVELHGNNTEIMDDNICQNGRMTNLYP